MGREIHNVDLALHKVTKITESKMLEFHFETFNAFNHAQFYLNGSIDRNVSSPTFGHVLNAAFGIPGVKLMTWVLKAI